jgi:hypothetical protein
MEKYNLEEGKESLDRIKLLMSYKNTMTLTENLEVVNEQENNVLSMDQMAQNVDNAVDYLDGYVTADNLKSLYTIVELLSRTTFEGKPALSEFLSFYSEDEGGDSFLEDINGVGVKTLGAQAIDYKRKIIELLNKVNQQPTQEWPECVNTYEDGKDGKGESVKIGPDGNHYYKNYFVVNPKNNKTGKYEC